MDAAKASCLGSWKDAEVIQGDSTFGYEYVSGMRNPCKEELKLSSHCTGCEEYWGIQKNTTAENLSSPY